MPIGSHLMIRSFQSWHVIRKRTNGTKSWKRRSSRLLEPYPTRTASWRAQPRQSTTAPTGNLQFRSLTSRHNRVKAREAPVIGGQQQRNNGSISAVVRRLLISHRDNGVGAWLLPIDRRRGRNRRASRPDLSRSDPGTPRPAPQALSVVDSRACFDASWRRMRLPASHW
jgi:hypothetical protein